jgi:hypothetical protein
VADVGDRVELKTKTGTRLGVVISVSGTLLRLRWDTGEETTLVPAAGVLRVLAPKSARPARRPQRKGSATKRAAPTKAPSTRTAAVNKASASKKVVAKPRVAGGPQRKSTLPSEPHMSSAERADKKKKSKKGKKRKP